MRFSTNSSLERQFNASLNLSNARMPQPQTLSMPLKITLCLVYCLIGVVTLFGNILTIAAFMRKNFQRKRVHYILMNLAITDLTVAAVPIPLTLLRLLKGSSMNLQTVLYLFDVLSGLTSMYSIAFVSVERLYAVCWPLRHRILKAWHYTVAILTTWLIAGIVAAISSDIFTFRMKLISPLVVLHIRTFFAAVPIFITVTAYCSLLVIRRCRKTALGVQQQNRGIACTLWVVTVVFLFTWCPFLIYSTTISYLRRYGLCCPPWSIDTIALTISLSKMLQYGNSCINPFIYTLRISAFRTAVWEILRCSKVVICSRENVISTSGSTGEMEMNTRTGTNTRRNSEQRKNFYQVEQDSNHSFSNLAYNEDHARKCLDVLNIQLINFKRLNSMDRRHDNTTHM